MEEVAADAATARHLAAMNDRDLADVGTKLDANRKAISALGEQTRARFDEVDRRFEQVDTRFERLEAKVDAGFARIEQLLTTRRDDRWTRAGPMPQSRPPTA